MKTIGQTMMGSPLKHFVVIASLLFGIASLGFSNTPQTHDVPMFHNDDGLGLVQDCTFMKARVSGTITEVPTTVAGRSIGCLSSIKSVTQVLYDLQGSSTAPTICLPSVDLNWLEVLNFVITYMENQPEANLSNKSYGVWIKESLVEKYPCD